MNKTSETRLESARQWKLRNRDRIKAYAAARNARIMADPELRKARAESVRHANGAKYRAYDKARDPLKMRARMSIRDRVRSGTIVRPPCSECGAPKAHAHHRDYNKRLDVQWLCRSCHQKLHKEMKSHA